MKVVTLLSIIFMTVFLTACSAYNVDQRRQTAQSIATKGGFQPFKLKTKSFSFEGYFKKGKELSEPIIYIEGDGFAWIDKYTISRNPTPRDPVGLKLASIDSASSVFYLPRPCQYVELKTEKNCAQKYWTNARFSPEVIASFHQALEQIKRKFDARGFHLVGFSGGGAVATLLTAQRDDIRSLRTVAGNLDHVSLNRQRKVSPLTESLNPIDFATRVRKTPQVHFVGREDEIIPKWVAKNFVEATRGSSCASYYYVSNVTHAKGWEKLWGNLHKKVFSCKVEGLSD
ncbi:alpha/beta fold hydrolase [Terasakiella pusilla]|uniref:alpha/beta fold hydrolase n=1 Tax=Terasakiella pusilla TaxID=64973 RepID=UPI003AA8553F